MRCISPLLIRKDGRRDFVPCGNCNFCLQTKRADWSFRLQYEAQHSVTGYFLTLTYEDDKVEFNAISGLPEVRKDTMQLFTKRIRKDNVMAMVSPLRYYSVGEYGTISSRPHYHSIMLNLNERIAERLQRYWPHGHVHAGEVTDASIHYVTKYVINRKTDYPGREPPFALMSRRPGLGAGYVDSHRHWHHSDKRNFTQMHGIARRIPRYLKDKIFDRFDRRYLTMQATDESIATYWDEVERLTAHHVDPFMYYDERVRYAHDAVTTKINSLNKF